MYKSGGRDITSIAPRQVESEERGLSISVEAIAWLGLILAAGLLRLTDLNGLPLTVHESARAFDAARVAGGEVPDTWRGDLAEAATSYLFRIFGESDLLARLVPAVAGLALVAVLWFARPYVGRVGALVTSALVAFSPLFVIHSRSAAEFSVGSLLGAVMMVSLFAHLQRPRIGLVFVLIVALAMAPLADAPAVLAAAGVIAFVAMESVIFGNNDVRRALRSFRSSPLQWVSALFVVSAAFQLGIAHFGTSVEKIDLPGLTLFGDMFKSPGDSRPRGYYLAMLLAYDWPLLLAGGAGFAFVALRFARGARAAVTPFDRLLLLWTVAAAFTLTLATRREAGQLLMLLLPLALLAGRLSEEVAARSSWETASRWWPAVAAALALAAAAAVLMTEWSSGRADEAERLLLLGTTAGFACLVGVMFVSARAGGKPAGAGVVAVLAAAFLVHSSLAVAFSDGTEFAVDMRTLGRTEQLRDTLDRLADERDGAIVVDGDLIDELGWTLRDSPVTFGGPLEGAAVVVSRPEASPAGFAGREEVWRVAEGWYPDELLAPRRMWRWLLYRRPYGGVETVEVRIYLRTI